VDWLPGTDVVIIADARVATVDFSTLVGWLEAAASSWRGPDGG
jgi:hypothetical protein